MDSNSLSWKALVEARALTKLAFPGPPAFVMTVKSLHDSAVDPHKFKATARSDSDRELWDLVFNYITRGDAKQSLSQSSHTKALIYLLLDTVSITRASKLSHLTYWQPTII